MHSGTACCASSHCICIMRRRTACETHTAQNHRHRGTVHCVGHASAHSDAASPHGVGMHRGMHGCSPRSAALAAATDRRSPRGRSARHVPPRGDPSPAPAPARCDPSPAPSRRAPPPHAAGRCPTMRRPHPKHQAGLEAQRRAGSAGAGRATPATIRSVAGPPWAPRGPPLLASGAPPLRLAALHRCLWTIHQVVSRPGNGHLQPFCWQPLDPRRVLRRQRVHPHPVQQR